MSHQLTAEQQRKIEENRQKALERRAQRLGQTVSSDNQTPVGFTSSLQLQPPKRSFNSEPAPVSHHTISAPKRFVPSFNQDPQRLNTTGNQINQSTDSVSSREVRLCAVIFSYWSKTSSISNIPCSLFSCRLKLLCCFPRQEVHMSAVQFCLARKILV